MYRHLLRVLAIGLLFGLLPPNFATSTPLATPSSGGRFYDSGQVLGS